MKNMAGKFAIVLSVLILVLFGNVTSALASSATIELTADKSSCEVGSEVTVTVRIKPQNGEPIIAYNMVMNYDSSVLDFVSATGEGNGGGGKLLWAIKMDSEITVRFKAKATGKADVSVDFTAFMIGGDDNASFNKPSLSITVNPKYVASTNNKLASLTVGGATLSPAFADNTTAYTCNVAANVSTLVVTAKQADAKAKIAVTGNTNLNYGRNEIVVTVTAESGATKRYVIICNRATPPAQQTTVAPSQAETVIEKPKVVIGDEVYRVSVKGATSWPAGFTAQNIDYKGSMVVGGYNNKNNMYLLQLESEGGEGAQKLYIYDAGNDTFTKFVAVDNTINNYVIMPMSSADKQLTGYDKKQMQIADNEVEVYANDDIYGVFYGMDAEGNIGWYRYCSADKTVQKYIPGEKQLATDETNEGNIADSNNIDNNGSDYELLKLIVIIALAVIVILLVIIIALVVKHKKDLDQAEFDALYASMPNKTGSAKAEVTSTPEIQVEQEENLELVEEQDETIELEIEETLEEEDDFNYLEIEETPDNTNEEKKDEE